MLNISLNQRLYHIGCELDHRSAATPISVSSPFDSYSKNTLLDLLSIKINLLSEKNGNAGSHQESPVSADRKQTSSIVVPGVIGSAGNVMAFLCAISQSQGSENMLAQM